MKYVVAMILGSILFGIATFIVRLVAPKWEHRTLPAWLGPTVLIVVTVIAVLILLVFG